MAGTPFFSKHFKILHTLALCQNTDHGKDKTSSIEWVARISSKRTHQTLLPPSSTSPNTHTFRGEVFFSPLLTHLLCFVKVSPVQQFSEIYSLGFILSFLFLPVLVIENHENVHQNNSDFRKEPQAVLCKEQGGGNLLKLDQKGFTKGRHYWEVDIEDTDEWTLGIYEEPTEKSELLSDLQKMKFNVLEKKGCEYRALICSRQGIFHKESLPIEKCPLKIVIFLDYEDSDISFYNMTDETHIFSFTHTNFSGSVYPYFKLKSMEFSPSA